MSIELLTASSVAGNVNTDFTVGSNSQYQILYAQIVLTTDVTAVNRRVLLQILDSSNNVIIDFHSGAVVPASQTSQHHEFMQGIFRETTFIGNALQVPIAAQAVLKAGWKLRISVQAGVAGDSYDASVVVIDTHAGAGV